VSELLEDELLDLDRLECGLVDRAREPSLDAAELLELELLDDADLLRDLIKYMVSTDQCLITEPHS